MDTVYETVEAAADYNYQVLKGRLNYRTSLEAAGVSYEQLCTSSECEKLSFECSHNSRDV